ncbi:MAG: PilZ domain-containing protein [Planctomycetia bacterium]|nr:PilZ domain-containing protein [Planctomycetia bacterium]
MPGNTTRHFPEDRRASRRVPVLFSAVLKRAGWRSQIAEVLDLSDSGARVMLRFAIPEGSDVALRVPGPHGKIEIPATVANCPTHGALPVAGLRFRAAEAVRRELHEIVERVDRARRRLAEEAAPAAQAAPAPGGTRVTRRTTRAKKPAKGGAGA